MNKTKTKQFLCPYINKHSFFSQMAAYLWMESKAAKQQQGLPSDCSAKQPACFDSSHEPTSPNPPNVSASG